jgi:4-hydroxybenzoate polyprenyltransferase
VNDVYDYDSDVQNCRKKKQHYWTEGGILHPVHHSFVLDAARVSTGLILLLGLFASLPSSPSPPSPLSLSVFICTASLLVLSWNYSAPPVRLKERPILDSLSNGVTCWLLWACGYTSTGRPLLGSQAGKTASNGHLIVFYASAIHSLGALLDIKPDNAAKHRTIATVLGRRGVATFSALCL